MSQAAAHVIVQYGLNRQYYCPEMDEYFVYEDGANQCLCGAEVSTQEEEALVEED